MCIKFEHRKWSCHYVQKQLIHLERHPVGATKLTLKMSVQQKGVMERAITVKFRLEQKPVKRDAT